MDTTEILTYCNPLPLPDYPRGRMCRPELDNGYGWLNNGVRHDFRETADPSVLYHDGRWYLYPSAGMAWVSEDFANWTRVSMNVDDIGYAPTIMRHRGRFYLNASDRVHSLMYVADSPTGPWQELGPVVGVDGMTLPDYWDPMFFSDDDERVYLYYGCGAPAIRGLEMDPERPCQAISEPVTLFAYNSEHLWERHGEFNEDPSRSWVEGPWMFKHNGTYYLTYCAPATQVSTYGMGCYTASSPLGPFAYQPRNPILRRTDGLVRGPGHGCVVRGPNDTVWAFYTCLRCYHHIFERRIGMDPAGFDAEGNLFVLPASDVPQVAPGCQAHPELGNDAGVKPVSICKPVTASSEAPGRACSYANDYSMRTWWEAAADDEQPWLEIDLGAVFRVSALRVIWAEPRLDYRHAPPGAMQYRVAYRDTNGTWQLLVDREKNETDLLIDYLTFAAVRATAVRLTVTGAPAGVGVGVVDLSLFGNGEWPASGIYG